MPRTKRDSRMRRKVSIRKTVEGTPGRPRLTVFRSLNHIYAQVIDDQEQRTLVSVSTLGKANADLFTGMKKTEQAKKAGELIAKRCQEKGIEQVVFDRNGYKYHGRVMALAAGAREAGLKF